MLLLFDLFERKKRENVITTKLRNFSRENITAAEKKRGILRPVTNIRQAIFDLLRLHPSPRYCVSFTGPINGVWKEASRMESSDRENCGVNKAAIL